MHFEKIPIESSCNKKVSELKERAVHYLALPLPSRVPCPRHTKKTHCSHPPSSTLGAPIHLQIVDTLFTDNVIPVLARLPQGLLPGKTLLASFH